MKSIVMALLTTLLVTGCLFSKKEEAPAEVPADQTAPAADANNAAPAAEPAPAE